MMEAAGRIDRVDMRSPPYHERVRAAGFQVQISGRWASVGRSKRRQGWKLHISSVPHVAGELLDTVLPILQDQNAPFKFASDETVLLLLNEGSLGPTQVGKFMTIYPQSDAACRNLAELLIAKTEEFVGPVIITDLRLGKVVYTRYGAFRSRNQRDRLGHYHSVLFNRKGGHRRDNRDVPFALPAGVRSPFSGFEHHKPESPPRSGKLFGPGYLLLDVLKSDPAGSVFLALDMRDPSTIASKVIKEGRAHCMSDRWGRNSRDRLQHQLSIHKLVSGKVPTPLAEDYFEVGENGYLVLSHVEGTDISTFANQPFGALQPRQQLRLLNIISQLVDAVGSLHSCSLVHRDLAPTNIRVGIDDTVILLDLELAHLLNSGKPSFTQGTAGFMSPEQEQGLPPDYPQDIYALGAIMVWLLTGIDPRRVLFAAETNRVAQLENLGRVPFVLAALVADCLSANPKRRPRISVIQESLRQIVASVSPKADARKTIPEPHRPFDDVKAKAFAALPGMLAGLLDSTLIDHHTGLWLSPRSGAHQKAGSDNSYALHRSAHRGVAGVIYMIARFAQVGVKKEDAAGKVQLAIDWLLQQEATPDAQMPGLHFGEAGVAVAIAEAVSAGLITRDKVLDDYFGMALAGPLDWPDLTHGAAGQGIAALICGQLLQDDNLHRASNRCSAFLVESQDADGGWTLPDGVQGMSGGRYLGFAHGTAGIVYFLAAWSAHANNSGALIAAIAGADFLLRHAHATKTRDEVIDWPTKLGDQETWRWWCHGGPGIALCFFKLYEVTGNARYAEIAANAAGSISTESRHSNLSQCHGLSGLGEVSLEMAKATGDKKWERHAEEMASCLLALGRETEEGGLSWLAEDSHHSTADLMLGSGGVAHFLLRFCHPELSPPLLLRSTTTPTPILASH